MGLVWIPQKRVGAPYVKFVFLSPVVSASHVVHSGVSRRETSTHYFSCSSETCAVSIKSALGEVMSNLCVLDPVGYTGHVVCSGPFGAQNIDALFFVLVLDWYGFQKKCAGRRYAKLVFCIQCDPWVTYCIAVHPGCETSMHYFSCSGGTGTDSRKIASRHVPLNIDSVFFHARVGLVRFP
jgi:hypothetical protein